MDTKATHKLFLMLFIFLQYKLNVLDFFKMLHAYDLIIFVHMHSVPYATDTTSSKSPSVEEECLRKF